jgi:MFS family permease
VFRLSGGTGTAIPVLVPNRKNTPLYAIYQRQWHFSAGILTLIFAVYAVAVLATLLLAGRTSDQAGRRPVMAAALGFSAASSVLFIFASSPGWLYPARVLSGVSAGLMIGTATAALTDMIRESAASRAALVSAAANTGAAALGPLMAGLFASLVPGFTTAILHHANYAVAGAVTCVFFAAGTVAAVGLAHLNSRPVLLAGLGLVLAGLALVVAGVSAASLAPFVVGTVVAGSAFGALVIGSLSAANRLALPETRAQVISTYFVFAYSGLAIPVIGVGVAADYVGNFRAVLGCSIVLALLRALAVPSGSGDRRSAVPHTAAT